MSTLALSIVLGVALAAATGFRVFLPMLIVSGAAYTGHLHLDDGFAWLGTPSALMMLSVAALAEVLAYYIPVVDNLLDTLATPAAFVAGTIVSAAVMIDAPPMVKWTAAVIAGGGIAGLTQGMTGILRAHSTVLTGGLGNPIIATAELGGAALISLLALAAPTIAIALVVVSWSWPCVSSAADFVERNHREGRRPVLCLPQPSATGLRPGFGDGEPIMDPRRVAGEKDVL